VSTPEGEVKAYLRERVTKLGGKYRFVKWIGRNHAPDMLIGLPGVPPTLVETKAPGKRPRPGQLREHERLREDFGLRVLVCPTKEDIDREFPIA
jgi:hypothetical protein